MASVLFGLANTANEINNIQSRNNYHKSRYSLDPEERELANSREVCNNKLNWIKLKEAFAAVLLPIIVLMIIVSVGVTNTAVYGTLMVWVMFGIAYLTYTNVKYAQIAMNINNDKNFKCDL